MKTLIYLIFAIAMNNLVPYGPLDEVSMPDGDRAFVGVDERIAPQLLAAGYVSGAKNMRFRNNRAGTRDGITLLPWMKGTGLTPFTEVYGGAVFSDPNQSGQWILVAADGGVWKTRPNAVAQTVPLPEGVTLTAGTFKKFIQANSAIVLLRGFDDEPLQCTDLNEGFKTIPIRNTWPVTFDHATNRIGLEAHNLLIGDPVRFTGASVPPQITVDKTYYVLDTPNADSFTITEPPIGTAITFNTSDTDTTVDTGTVEVLDGASNIPPSDNGVFHLNRLFLINGKDTLVVSDIGDFTRYLPIQSVFRINEGDSHTLLALAQFNKDTMLFFKSGSVLKALGISGDLSEAAGPFNVTPAYGIAGPDAVVAHGTNIFWLTSEFRVSSLRLTEFNEDQGTNTALSDPLLQTFGRINAGYASAARLAVFDGFLHVALPLDDANLVSDTEIVPEGLTYAGFPVPVAITGLTVGQTYQYRQGANGGSLVNGTETLEGDADFVAQDTTVDLIQDDNNAAQDLPVTESIKQVLATGINTAVAVYDFLNQAWCGSDEAAGVTLVKDWLKFQYGGRERLGFIGADGWLHLYGEGFEDEKLLPVEAPYVDVLADRITELADGVSTIRVNNGDTVVAVLQEVNDTDIWGINFGVERENLGDGFAGLLWAAPFTTPEQIDYGIRFVATNGVLPEIKIDGVVVANGVAGWAFVDSHSGSEITPVPIVSWVRPRAYLCQMDATKRYTCLALQLATWSPDYTIKTLVQGTGTETAQAEDQTRDRLKYFDQFDKDDWIPTNENEDFAEPGREDYSWQATNEGILLGSEGVDFDTHQEYVHRIPISERGLWLQPDITCNEGRLELVAVAMEAQQGDVLGGIAVN